MSRETNTEVGTRMGASPNVYRSITSSGPEFGVKTIMEMPLTR